VIDLSNDALEAAADSGLLGLRGDAADASVLADASVARARAVLVCTGRDDTGVLVCLSVRSLARKVRIVAAVKNPRRSQLMAQSGADMVLSPSGLGGRVIAEAVDNSNIAAILADLASARGDVTLRERNAAETEVGRSPREIGPGLVLGLRRGQALLWVWDPAAARIESGDRLVLIAPTTAVSA
jgi:voltage-gated potassium channel